MPRPSARSPRHPAVPLPVRSTNPTRQIGASAWVSLRDSAVVAIRESSMSAGFQRLRPSCGSRTSARHRVAACARWGLATMIGSQERECTWMGCWRQGTPNTPSESRSSTFRGSGTIGPYGLVIGSQNQLEAALVRSEDSQTLNTSFIERLNLTIRQGSAYLHRKTPCHARRGEYLDQHLELLRCHCNFVRPHRALKFGQATRTPAMQAGLVSRRLSFREILLSVTRLPLCVFILVRIEVSPGAPRRSSMAA